MATFSIIVIAWQADAALKSCLAAIHQERDGAAIELLVSCPNHSPKLKEICATYDARFVPSSPGRGQQLDAGAKDASSDWLLFLHSDSILGAGWSHVVRNHCTHSQAPAAFRLRFRAKGVGAFLTAGWANVRSRYFGLPYGDQGLLVTRHRFHEVGGFRALPLMEDVAIARALGRKITLLDHEISTSPERYIKRGWLRQGSRNIWMLLCFLCGADPAKLAARYQTKD